jgi:hypothetical protein
LAEEGSKYVQQYWFWDKSIEKVEQYFSEVQVLESCTSLPTD